MDKKFVIYIKKETLWNDSEEPMFWQEKNKYNCFGSLTEAKVYSRETKEDVEKDYYIPEGGLIIELPELNQ